MQREQHADDGADVGFAVGADNRARDPRGVAADLDGEVVGLLVEGDEGPREARIDLGDLVRRQAREHGEIVVVTVDFAGSVEAFDGPGDDGVDVAGDVAFDEGGAGVVLHRCSEARRRRGRQRRMDELERDARALHAEGRTVDEAIEALFVVHSDRIIPMVRVVRGVFGLSISEIMRRLDRLWQQRQREPGAFQQH